MKHAARLMILAGGALLLLAMVASSNSRVNTQSVSLKTTVRTSGVLRADGGAPIPPFPPSGSLLATRPILSADGGAPIPPFPPSGSLLATRLILSL